MNNKFNIGDIVYLIHDTEQLPRMVTGINVRSNGLIYRFSATRGLGKSMP